MPEMWERIRRREVDPKDVPPWFDDWRPDPNMTEEQIEEAERNAERGDRMDRLAGKILICIVIFFLGVLAMFVIAIKG